MTQRLYENGLVREEDYARTMADVVLPALAACREEGYFTGAGGKQLYYAAYPAPAPRGTAVVLHGFTENEYKYAELIHSLLRAGWSVCAYDQRGHGRSWRDESLRDTPWLTHVERFGDYVEDLECFVEQVASRLPGPRVLFMLYDEKKVYARIAK